MKLLTKARKSRRGAPEKPEKAPGGFLFVRLRPSLRSMQGVPDAGEQIKFLNFLSKYQEKQKK